MLSGETPFNNPGYALVIILVGYFRCCTELLNAKAKGRLAENFHSPNVQHTYTVYYMTSNFVHLDDT